MNSDENFCPTVQPHLNSKAMPMGSTIYDFAEYLIEGKLLEEETYISFNDFVAKVNKYMTSEEIVNAIHEEIDRRYQRYIDSGEKARDEERTRKAHEPFLRFIEESMSRIHTLQRKNEEEIMRWLHDFTEAMECSSGDFEKYKTTILEKFEEMGCGYQRVKDIEHDGPETDFLKILKTALGDLHDSGWIHPITTKHVEDWFQIRWREIIRFMPKSFGHLLR